MDHLETFKGLSCLQIETLVYTSQRYLQHLENGSMEGFWRWSWCRQRTCRPNLVELAPWEEKSIISSSLSFTYVYIIFMLLMFINAFWRTPHKPFKKDVFEAAMEENDGPDANDYSPDEFDLCEEATGYKEHRWDIERLIGSGGIPPSHFVTVTALAIVVGLHDGLGGSTFATALILACIVMYDATEVRLHVGRQAEVMNQIVFELPAEHPLAESRYVPNHLHLMVFELVKNSLRAVEERFMDSDKLAPPIRIIVADGLEDVTIKISDEGGGIPRSGLPKIFTYLYSTAKNPLNERPDLGTADIATMAGYGFGLPISRLYARYFGGDLQIISMEGYA
nr:pyruvate dehydrogenase (acetyl-transferring) kinase, mitochondrial [Tanacetum cinerariifolium]